MYNNKMTTSFILTTLLFITLLSLPTTSSSSTIIIPIEKCSLTLNPYLSHNSKTCNKFARKCLVHGIYLDWKGWDCGKKIELGCRCSTFCGFTCEKECTAKLYCHWNSNSNTCSRKPNIGWGVDYPDENGYCFKPTSNPTPSPTIKCIPTKNSPKLCNTHRPTSQSCPTTCPHYPTCRDPDPSNTCRPACNLADCNWDFNLCTCSDHCRKPIIRLNGRCDAQCNTFGCSFDNLECCTPNPDGITTTCPGPPPNCFNLRTFLPCTTHSPSHRPSTRMPSIKPTKFPTKRPSSLVG
jgi:hypothetical protein